MAISLLLATGSTAMRCLAPANAAPCTALMPTPPIPYTTVVSPGRTLPAFTAVPQPVGTPQPTSATVSSGRSSSILTQECSDTTALVGHCARPQESRPHLGVIGAERAVATVVLTLS